MSRFFRLLIIVLAGFVASPAVAQLVVCGGDPVQFQLQETYYGVKTWEFSPDNVAWEPITVEEETDLLITPEMVGYYRVRFDDVDCGTTYYSNVVQVSHPEPVLLHSLYSTGVIPMSIDPVVWLDGFDELTGVTYVINGEVVPAFLEFQPVPNPGVDFTVHATATDASGCSLHSDTLHFTVFNSAVQGTGSFISNTGIPASNVIVASSGGAVQPDMNGNFALTFSLDYGYLEEPFVWSSDFDGRIGHGLNLVVFPGSTGC